MNCYANMKTWVQILVQGYSTWLLSVIRNGHGSLATSVLSSIMKNEQLIGSQLAEHGNMHLISII